MQSKTLQIATRLRLLNETSVIIPFQNYAHFPGFKSSTDEADKKEFLRSIRKFSNYKTICLKMSLSNQGVKTDKNALKTILIPTW